MTQPVQFPVTYAREAVLDIDQLAAGLGVSRRIAEGLDLPSFKVGERRRWLWGQVLDILAERAA